MEILGNRNYVAVPGDAVHELPPLLVHEKPRIRELDRLVELAAKLIEKEDLVPSHPLDEIAGDQDAERRKMDMAINMADLYVALLKHWQWGDDVLEWIRQCEITFEQRAALRPLLRPDVWPHAARSSFVTLLTDKSVPTRGVEIERAVGLRLTFRKPPAIDYFSEQFLVYLHSKLGNAAYSTWAGMSPAPISSLPPERFEVNVLAM